MTNLILIAAISENHVIGNHGKILWKIPEDMKRFKELTLDKPVIMGRKTYESIGRALPQRTNIVITKNTDFHPTGVVVAHSINEALAQSRPHEHAYIIGGQHIYEQTINLADKLEITHVHQHFDGDTFFPTIDTLLWKETARTDREGYSFVTYTRK